LYGNIGSVYKELGEYEKSIDYHKRAMKLANETGNKSLYVNSVVNLGGVFYDYAKYDSAVYYYNLVLPEPNLSENPDVLITIYLNLSFINIALSEFEKARNYIAKAKEVIDKNDFTRSKIYYYNAIAELFAKEGDINKAITNTLAAYKLSDSLGEKTNMVNMLSNLCDMYAGINDYKNAYKYTLVKESVKDSVFNEKKAQIIKELEVKFLVEKKNLEIEKLKARQEADRRLRILLVSVLVFIISLSILLLYVLYEKRKRSEVEKELINTEKEKTVEKLHFQNRQLASQALTMMQKNKMLQELQKSISEIVKEKPENIGKQLNKIKFQIKRSINSEKDWEVFRLYFEQVNKTFFKNLKDINPELTDYDLRMAALIKLKLNIKESASLLNLSPNSVKGTRYRLRKKLGLSNSESLTDYIGNID
jgi:Tfp pilus assembly protein PilF